MSRSARVSGFGFRVSGFGFRVSGFGLRVSGFGFRVSGFGFRVDRPSVVNLHDSIEKNNRLQGLT